MKRKYHHTLITGASSGIGLLLCRELASSTWKLTVSGRNSQALIALERDLQNRVEVQKIVADLANPQERARVCKVIEDQNVDLVINNAGFGLYGQAIDLDLKEQMELLEVNATAVLELTLTAIKSFKKRDVSGIVLNISSSAGELATPYKAVYGASKSFVTRVSLALDYECRNENIRVLTSSPGMVKTTFQTKAAKKKVEVHSPLAITAEKAVQKILFQLEKKKSFYCFNFLTKSVIMFSKLLPSDWGYSLIARSIKNRL